MKCFLLLVVFTFTTSILALSQNDTICGILPQRNGMIYYEQVVVKEGVSAKQLYSTTKIWISESFKDSRAVTQVDVENSTITIKGILHSWDPNIKFSAVMNIQFKDNKYKFDVSNIRLLIPKFEMDNSLESREGIIAGQSGAECDTNFLLKVDGVIKKLIYSLRSKLDTSNYSW